MSTCFMSVVDIFGEFIYSFIVVEVSALAGLEGKGGLRPLLVRLFLEQ